MKKLICIFISAMMLLCLCACSGDNENTTNAPESTSENTSESTSENTSENTNETGIEEIDLSDIKEKIIDELKIEGAMDIATDRLSDLYGIDSSDVEESSCFITSNGSFPEEVIMIKAKDSDAQKRIADLLETRIDDVKVQSESYDPENYAIAQKCKVITNGNYLVMFISALHEQMEKIFAQSIG